MNPSNGSGTDSTARRNCYKEPLVLVLQVVPLDDTANTEGLENKFGVVPSGNH